MFVISRPNPSPAEPPRRLPTAAAFRQLELMEASVYLPTPEEERSGEHGEVFTRRWVVDLILDLVGYTPDRDLVALRAIEPACGSGAFLIPMVERLIESASNHGRDLATATDAVLAIDLLQGNVDLSRDAVASTLESGGVLPSAAGVLASAWVHRRDFLLEPPAPRTANFVVGNPPYIRLEAVPRERSDAYRRSCNTMGGRADVYVGFYEHALLALCDNGALGFICADRWMRNAYGAHLRELISTEWAVETLLSMTGVDAFEDEVDAYPAVTIIRRQAQEGGPLVVDGGARFGHAEGREVVALASKASTALTTGRGYRAARLDSWFKGRAGWPNGSPQQLAVIAALEARLPALEDPETGTKVGIGVATGADKIYVTRDANLIENERLLRLALPRDIATGRLEWSGKYLVNPWDANGLVDIREWPQLARYLGQHREVLSQRHTAKRGQWYKTIDRVIDGLVDRPKIYLPDFKDAIFPVLDDGGTYPHHNLYWVTSDAWDMRILGGLLLSDVANLFIEAYSVRMRGGYLRFQAQYLRRIRLPHLADVDEPTGAALAAAFDAHDRRAATEAALPLYGIDKLPA